MWGSLTVTIAEVRYVEREEYVDGTTSG